VKQHAQDFFPSALSSTRLILCFFSAEEPGLEKEVLGLVPKGCTRVCLLGGVQS
jgi:hypothetical protein